MNKPTGKSKRRTIKLMKRFRRTTDESEILKLADAIERRAPGFKQDVGLEQQRE